MLSLDLYQITTLMALLGPSGSKPLTMSFFFRKLPRERNFVVSCGLRSIIDHCQKLQITPEEWETLQNLPMLKDLWGTLRGQRVKKALLDLNGFEGEIDALPEGTLAFAGPAFRSDGEPLMIKGIPIQVQTPLVQARTTLPFCKLIETPWLSRLNHQSMVASKAARVVLAARSDGIDRPVLEFGQRRTNQEAAIEAAYAAYLAGCAGTSNLAATHRYGIPAAGTMDHFAIQAAERVGIPTDQTERDFFGEYQKFFPNTTLLVDTYDTFWGIENAVRGTGGKLGGIRIDSNVKVETLLQARQLLQELGAPHVKIFLSDGLNEYRVRDLARAGADGFGVGENISCSPDAATGIGAVGKLVDNGEKPTMKLSLGSGKMTLPGRIQAYRFPNRDLLTLWDEPVQGGIPLLQPVWRGRGLVQDLPSLEQSRQYVRDQLGALPADLQRLEVSPKPWPIFVSDGLAHLIETLMNST